MPGGNSEACGSRAGRKEESCTDEDDAHRSQSGERVPDGCNKWLSLCLLAPRKAADVPSPAAVPAGTWPEGMITMSSSYEPTSATAGHAATTAPDRPWPDCAQHWPRASPRSPAPADSAPAPEPVRSAAPSRASPSNWRRSARPPCLALHPDQGIGVLVGRNRSDCRDTGHRARDGNCHYRIRLSRRSVRRPPRC